MAKFISQLSALIINSEKDWDQVKTKSIQRYESSHELDWEQGASR